MAPTKPKRKNSEHEEHRLRLIPLRGADGKELNVFDLSAGPRKSKERRGK